MDPLKMGLASLALASAGPAMASMPASFPVAEEEPGHGGGPWADYVAEASSRFGIPAAWIARVMAAESGGHTMLAGRPIVSRAGAIGLMQLMPGTWGAMRDRLGLGADPHDPRDNILAGSFYLRLLYDRFGYPGLFAAYNAGPGRYAEFLDAGRPLPAETRAYLAKLDVRLAARDGDEARAPGRGIFLVLRCARDPAAPDRGDPGGLFAVLGGQCSGNAKGADGEGPAAAP